MRAKLTATLALDTPVVNVNGVSPARAAVLHSMGVRSVRDLVQHYPRRYLDMSQVSNIAQAKIGENVTIIGTVHECILKRPKPKVDLVEVTVIDGTSTMIATFFKQPWLAKTIRSGMKISMSGKMEFNFGFKRMTSPFYEVLDDASAAAGKIIPVHKASEKLPAGQIRRLVSNALSFVDGLYDPLPLHLRTKYRLMSRNAAWHAIHFPMHSDEAAQAKRRLAYEELLFLELKLMGEARKRSQGSAFSHAVPGKFTRALESFLPFDLTEDQKAAISDISERMQADSTMNHMLLGDVGTGKTIVAAFACALAADSGTQTLMMAPTEVLASQYARTLGPLFDEAGITWALLTGSTGDSRRRDILSMLASGHTDVLFGTHALLEDDVACNRMGLAIIDEQQRFGVDQRERLLAKQPGVDCLSMTATPIPRSLALAVFGSHTLSYLRTVPFERPPRRTTVLDYRNKGVAYDAALAACRRGEQAYVVCPLVGKKQPAGKDGKPSRLAQDEDLSFIESDSDMAADNAAAAEAEAAFLQAKTFFDYKVGLLHGKLSSQEKHRVMEDFHNGDIDVLVCTTVIEVGVDVPNATVMVIEDADRFGLSQLHQLRGRVGRGTKPGEVYLIGATANPVSAQRLEAMAATEDGFALAEFDLGLRREGDIMGNRQSGASTLKMVNVVRDGSIIEAAHADAQQLMEDPGFWESPQGHVLKLEIDAVFAAEDAL